jgi:hypothetical protein
MGQIEKLEWYAVSCCRVLSITTLAYRPLHLLELRILAGLEEMTGIQKLVHLCGSFLTIRRRLCLSHPPVGERLPYHQRINQSLS